MTFATFAKKLTAPAAAIAAAMGLSGCVSTVNDLGQGVITVLQAPNKWMDKLAPIPQGTHVACIDGGAKFFIRDPAHAIEMHGRIYTTIGRSPFPVNSVYIQGAQLGPALLQGSWNDNNPDNVAGIHTTGQAYPGYMPSGELLRQQASNLAAGAAVAFMKSYNEDANCRLAVNGPPGPQRNYNYGFDAGQQPYYPGPPAPQ